MFVSEVLNRFVTYLEGENRETLGRVVTLQNGFEGWLKSELAAFLMHEYKRVAHKERNGVGLEYTARLRGRSGDRSETKKVDVWTSTSTEGDRYAYIELKVAFPNGNWNKQTSHWESDAHALRALDPWEAGSEWASVLFVPNSDASASRIQTLRDAEGVTEVQPSGPAGRPRLVSVFLLQGELKLSTSTSAPFRRRT